MLPVVSMVTVITRLGHALALLLVAVLSLVGLGAVPGAAAADPPVYVALGDSYSSGTGTGVYAEDGTSCLRSPYAYPSLLAAERGAALNLRACSGAVVDDVRDVQLPALDASTDYVTISVGGNDAGFADVLTTCALPWWLGRCGRAVDAARDYVDDVLPGRVAALYAELRRRAPNAEVVVVGYPRIFGDEDCNPLTFFSSSDRRDLNGASDLINLRLRQQAIGAGFAYADPRARFTGHAVCARAPWLNDLRLPIEESYHPNRAGHASGYAATVRALLPVARASSDRAPRVTAASIARAQRPYADLDRGIEPAVVDVPDLDTPRARRAARRHGIDLDRWVRRHTR